MKPILNQNTNTPKNKKISSFCKNIKCGKYLNIHKASIILTILLLVFSFSYGVFVGYSHNQPFGLIQSTYMKLLRKESYKEIPKEISTESLNKKATELIHISNGSDVFKKRTDLIKYIWGEKTTSLPNKILPKVTQEINDKRYSDMLNLQSIDKLETTMKLGLNSIAYHFKPNISNNRLVIYHQGHKGDFLQGKDIIESLLTEGYAVIALTMPLLGMNNNPIVDTNIYGELQLMSHDDFHFLFLDTGSPIQFFVEPLVAILNYTETLNYKDTSMMGISGGGWTTVLYSAIDPRISKSYPVAGSLPIYLKNLPSESGDYEQGLFSLYSIANYLELYTMASYEKDRKQLQIFNRYESGTFSGVRYKAYEDIIKKILLNIDGGSFNVFLDESHKEHKISKLGLETILNDLDTTK